MPRARTLIGYALWVYVGLQALMDVLGAIDFVVERTADPGWLRDVANFALNPPRYFLLGAVVLGFVLVFWSYITKLARDENDGSQIALPDNAEPDARSEPIAPDLSHWNLDRFTLLEAASLWAEMEPLGLEELERSPKAKARYRMLTEAIEKGEIVADQPFDPAHPRTIFVPREGQHAPHMLVDREDLRNLALAKGERPRFLFVEREPAQQPDSEPSPDLKAVEAFNEIIDFSQWAHEHAANWRALPAVVYENSKTEYEVIERRLSQALDRELHDLLAQGKISAWGRSGPARVEDQIPREEWKSISIDFSPRTLAASASTGGPPDTCAFKTSSDIRERRLVYSDVRFSAEQLYARFPLTMSHRRGDGAQTSYAAAILATAKGFRAGTVDGRLKAAEARWKRGAWEMMVRIMPDERVYCPELVAADRTRLSEKQVELLAEYKTREDQLEDYIKNVAAGVRAGKDAASGFLHKLRMLSQRLNKLIDNWNA